MAFTYLYTSLIIVTYFKKIISYWPLSAAA